MRVGYRAGMVLLALLAFAAGESRLFAQAAWQPSPGHTQLPIWPGAVPDAQPVDGPEVAGTVVDAGGNKRLVGGKPWVYVDRVSQPTMTVYAPQGRNTGAAVVVFPGGGYNILAIDLEGTEVCDWLTSTGITCVLLKYRVPCVKVGPYRDCLTALEDAQRTVGLVRFQAAQWHIDPRKIGVLGFSAGGHMVAAISTHFGKRLYPAVDAADNESCRPDFAVALYPGHLAVPEKNFALNPDIQVTSATPPTFLLQAEDDPVDPVENSLVYYSALRKAGVPAELHVYVKGGHAFGLRPTESPITRWPQLVETWLTTVGMTQRARLLERRGHDHLRLGRYAVHVRVPLLGRPVVVLRPDQAQAVGHLRRQGGSRRARDRTMFLPFSPRQAQAWRPHPGGTHERRRLDFPLSLAQRL